MPRQAPAAPGRVAVNVRLGSGLRTDSAQTRLRLDVPAGTSVGEVVSLLAERHQELAARLPEAIAIVGGERVASSRRLDESGEIAFLLPVAGG